MTDPHAGREQEDAQAIFERINRRRDAADGARRAHAAREPGAQSGQATSAAPAVMPDSPAPLERPSRAALRIDEFLVDDPRDIDGSLHTEPPMPDTFPRSATMRMLIRHPALTLGVGIPAAVLLLRSPASRRLVQAGLALGMSPEVRAQLAASVTAASRRVQDGRRERTGEP
jgi:hypothetical protein